MTFRAPPDPFPLIPIGRNAALVLTACILMTMPGAALAQETYSPPAVVETDSAQPIETQPNQTQPEAAQEPAEPAQLTEPAFGPVEVEPASEPAPEPEPAPSFMENPAGAITHLMRQADRDSNLPHDLSPWGMFLMADWVVKGVMILLAAASFAVWVIWLAKIIEIACAKARAKRAAGVIASASALADASHRLAGRGGPAAFMVRSAEDELRRSEPALDHAGTDGVKERLGARLSRIEAQAGRRLSRGTGLLAIVGSTAPFIGLFGTVWGIMNSFIGISQANTTNLAVVAPGIAEALLATAIGLVAAIPAVIVYNLFARSIASYGQLLADASSGVEQLVSLDLDLRKVPARTKSLALKSDAVPMPSRSAEHADIKRAHEAAAAAAE